MGISCLLHFSLFFHCHFTSISRLLRTSYTIAPWISHSIRAVLEYSVRRRKGERMTTYSTNICATVKLPAPAVRTRGSGHVHKIKSDQIRHTHTYARAHPCLRGDSGVSLYPGVTVIFQGSLAQHLCTATALMNPRRCILQDRIIPYRSAADNRSQRAKTGCWQSAAHFLLYSAKTFN